MRLLLKSLVSSFKHLALQGLGKVANQFTGRPDIDLEQAQFAIDTLSMLMQKTNGNLSDREQHELQGVIHTLRINYLDVKREVDQPKLDVKKPDISTVKEYIQEEIISEDEEAEKPKRTPFYRFHKELGAKIVPFAGYEMPVQYEGINQEHLHVRTGVGVFDVSHMGEFYRKRQASREVHLFYYMQ